MVNLRWAVAVVILLLSAAAVSSGAADEEPQPARVEFNRDIRPIFSDKCFACHGPDEATRMSPLRLDTPDGATADLGGRAAIVPGDAANSEIVRRVASDDDAVRMPPAYAGHKKLSHTEIGLITRWVEQGAEWQSHWSFLPPRRPPLPKVNNQSWPRNPIDYFVLRRLEREGLQPSPEAGRETLIRRVTLDLTGLPPTPAEVNVFVNDRSPDAYEKVVDRLLASPRYGERMAIRWLDAARYADTNGYQTDAERYMWRWRDWVIEAFNNNMPFDQFTVEQLAGDMLPDPTLDQIIATGFNRNHRGNGEGGIIAAEFAVEYVVDRVETTSTVWLGATMGCARCHDHKYDPFTQKEFYQLYAYFNNVPENGKAFKYGNSPPLIKAPTREQQAVLKEHDRKLEAAQRKLAALQPEIRQAQQTWEKTLAQGEPLDWKLRDGLLAHYPLDGDVTGSIRGENGEEGVPGTVQEGETDFTPGRLGQAAALDGVRYIEGADVAQFDFYDRFSLAAWIQPAAPDGPVVSRTTDNAEGEGYGYEGYGLYLKDGKLQVNLVRRWLDDCIRIETTEPLPLNRWRHVAMTYDGTRLAKGIRIYVNGEPQKIKVLVDEMNQHFKVSNPLRIGASGPDKRFRGSIDDVRVYDVALTPQQVAVVATDKSLREIARLPPKARTHAQADKSKLAFLDRFAPEPIQQAWRRLQQTKKERQSFVDTLPSLMVMQEMEPPRDTHLLNRGAYDSPGEKVTPSVPAILPPLPEGYPNNRLGFARWLVHPSNPLPARVTVNRFWQTYFGTGLVKTVEDFGSQGEWPTHPELLDWLATEFIRTGWDVKALQKTIVTSATYRQASKVTPALFGKDPDNRLLARGPRFRLPAEAVRDQALAVSGLLVEKLGGPSVKPYQPAGLWSELAGSNDYEPDRGEDLYRRSLYTFWKRAVPPPSMMNFDSAGREACTVRATRTNTPLQALNLMNDLTFIEASRVLAQRMMTEGGESPAGRINFAFRLATARKPKPAEQDVLLSSFRQYLDHYQTDPESALKLVSEGEAPRDESLDVRELASYTTVASLILNLDETVTKE